MRVQDFGHFDEGVTLFGGPYSNLQALEALAALVERPAICTGDVVAYGGDPAATVALIPSREGTAGAGDLLPAVYEELRRIARHKMAAERAEHTLQATALVHEAWLRLENSGPNRWENRRHFFAARKTQCFECSSAH